jgi:NADH-quinone oxidoreductase subunit N
MILGQFPTLQRPEVDLTAIGPEIALISAGVLLVLIGALNRGRRDLTGLHLAVGLGGVVAAALCTKELWSVVIDDQPYEALSGMVAVDGFAVFARTVILAATALGLLLAQGYLKREGIQGPEYHALLLMSASGMLMMTSANDLIVVFLALEVLSIALYVLAAFDKRRLESQEAGLKYFVLGAFSSAVFLYGVALTYGATGTTSLSGMARFLTANSLTSSGLLLAGLALLLVGLGFKVAAVPFHMWTPDVYQGAPSPVTGFMAAGAKTAGFAALLRVFATSFRVYELDWKPLVWVLAIASLAVGSIVAIAQEDIKRMLAYSSINHAGYILIGFQANTGDGISSAMFYLLTYTFMVVGSFAVVGLVARRGDRRSALADYRGLGARSPALAAALTFLLLAQAGIPLTSGFVAKFGIFSAAVDERQYALLIIGSLTTVVAAFFYLRVIVLMYMSVPEDGDTDVDTHPIGIDLYNGAALAVACVATLVMGVFPSAFIDFARDATFLF